MKNLTESPNVLIVPNAHGEFWRMHQELDYERGPIVTYRRADLYVQIRDGEPGQRSTLECALTIDEELVRIFPPDVLVQELGRQIVLALKEHIAGPRPCQDKDAIDGLGGPVGLDEAINHALDAATPALVEYTNTFRNTNR